MYLTLCTTYLKNANLFILKDAGRKMDLSFLLKGVDGLQQNLHTKIQDNCTMNL